MKYSLRPGDVIKTLDEISFAYVLKDFTDEQFLFYHVNRNYFNVKSEIKTLTCKKNGEFIDNSGHIWKEVDITKNMFHMPKANYLKSVVGLDKPYSRKFLRDDNISGIGGEFEMIIRYDGKRIDALTNPEYQETYNFGRTRNTLQHILLDIAPHKFNPNYKFRQDMGKVEIIEPEK